MDKEADQPVREILISTYPQESEKKYFEGNKEEVLEQIKTTIEELLEKSPEGKKTVCIWTNPYVVISKITDFVAEVS